MVISKKEEERMFTCGVQKAENIRIVNIVKRKYEGQFLDYREKRGRALMLVINF